MERLEGSRMHEKNLAEEMMELRKLTTAVMMKKCRSMNEGVACPKPQRRNDRHVEEQNVLKLGEDLLDIIIVGKASPPYYSGSPPVRVSNPLIQDALFCEQRLASPIITLHAKSVDGANRNRRMARSIPTMA